MSASAGPFRVLTSEVSIVDGDDELSASTARPGYSVFCFDIMVAGAKMAGLQFQNSACSHIRVAQDQGGRWVEVMGWTPLLLHDYADELELETWHFVPVTMVSPSRAAAVPGMGRAGQPSAMPLSMLTQPIACFRPPSSAV